MLNQIRIVLVNTSHPGNIGAAARAMKTMGLSQLYLVSPISFPHPKAQEMASNAGNILENAQVVATLDQAITDCHWVIGTSARLRTIPWPLLSPRDMAEKINRESGSAEIAIIFGREQSGLTNEELHRCHYHIHIPTHPDYASLNLAQAVQVITYELYNASLTKKETVEWDYPLATAEHMERFYTHLESTLIEIDFLKKEAPRQLMTRLRRLFSRAHPDVMEINILRGWLATILEVKKKCKK